MRLFAYDGEAITEDDFVDVYPLLPGHIDLILQVTSALRTLLEPQPGRRPGDPRPVAAARRVVPRPGLADREVGALVTLDQMYEVSTPRSTPTSGQPGPGAASLRQQQPRAGRPRRQGRRAAPS
ncbi:MAG: hypothetical protein IPH44_43565 [Myxococcales bacterium]|nr:hypothetical protein [Myxococcales bacterium]